MQERFIASAKGTAPPAPILRRLGTTKHNVAFAGVAAAAFVALLTVVLAGYGSLGSGSSVQPIGMLVVYAVLLFLLPYGVIRALGLVLEARALPFKPGIYVFPMCVVDARQKRMRVAPVTDLVKVEPGTPFRLSYKTLGTIEFPSNGEPAEQLKFSFDVAQENAKHALATNDEAELVTLDPFYEPKKFVSPIGPQEPLIERVPAWVKYGWAIALGVAIVFAPLSYFVRNSASDDKTLERAKSDGSPGAFRSYLEYGRRHREEVSDVLLPRAELEVAKKQHTVDAILGFIHTHPGSKIDDEAKAALHDAYVAELEKAKAKGTVSALDEFTKRYPEHHLDQEVVRAKHALYVAALGTLKKKAPGLGPEGNAFMDKLFGFLEAHGPKTVVVLRREISPGLGRADKLIGASPLNRTLGPRQVTKYFPEGKPPSKESEVVKALAQTLGKIVPADVLRLEQGPTPADQSDDAIVSQANAPVIVIRYRIGWQGVAFSSNQLKRAFAGIHVTGDAAFYVPNEPNALKTKIDVPPPRALLVKYESPSHPGLNTDAPSEQEPETGIYATMEMRALDQFTTSVEQMILPSAR